MHLTLAARFRLPPASLGGENLTDLIDRKKAAFKADPKYPQAIGISNIQSLTTRFGNSHWELLRNTFDNSPFFTSDYPVAIERTDDVRVLNRIVPLTPTLAVRIRKPSRREVSAINRLIVQSADDLVFFRDDAPG